MVLAADGGALVTAAKRKQRAVATGETIASTSTPKKRKRYSANDEPSFNTTDLGNAKLFAHLTDGRVLFDHKQGRWLVWNKAHSRWWPDSQKKVWALAEAVARYWFAKAKQMPHGDENEQKLQKRSFSFAYACEKRQSIDAFLELAKSQDPISDSGERWDADPWLLGVANGVVDLRTGTFRTGTQSDRITKFSPVVFDAAATCPRFELFVSEIFAGDAELIRYVQKAVGYSLTGETSEQCLFANWGNGSNGKTTFLEILYRILGDYAKDLPFTSLEAKQHRIGDGVTLVGARFVKAVEVREGVVLDEGRIKAWTGGDSITVRPFHHNEFSFRPQFKLWMSFNHKPKITDDSVAMWRRIQLIPFTQTFNVTNMDKDLPKKLRAEAPGILNWAIVGCLAWQAEGLPTPKAVEQATIEYADESDHLTAFLEERCELDPSFDVSKNELRQAYDDWCRTHKERPKNKNDFPQAMRSRRFGEDKTNTSRSWKGLRLRAPEPVPDLAEFADLADLARFDTWADMVKFVADGGVLVDDALMAEVTRMVDAAGASDTSDTTIAISVFPLRERE